MTAAKIDSFIIS